MQQKCSDVLPARSQAACARARCAQLHAAKVVALASYSLSLWCCSSANLIATCSLHDIYNRPDTAASMPRRPDSNTAGSNDADGDMIVFADTA